jgi:uncharacterized protein
MNSQLALRVNSYRDGEREPIDIVVDATEAGIADLHDAVEFTGPLTLSGHAYRDEDEVMVTARAEVPVSVSCGRCLVEERDTLESDIFIMYRPEDQRPDFLEGEEEVGLGYYDEGIIDLREDVRRYLLLEIPLWPVCGDDCKGLCRTCGVNLNESACACARDDDAPRNALTEQLDRLLDN